jgi:hypothetical protein
VSRFYPLVTGDEPVPTGGIWMKAALANVNGTEIELIQPLGDLWMSPFVAETMAKRVPHFPAEAPA